MSPDTFKISYDFLFPDKTSKSYVFDIDKNTLALVESTTEQPPEWAKLENKKCEHCPLKEAESPYCPVARNIAHLVETFKEKVSYTEVAIKVTTKERTYVKTLPLQEGIFSVFGLVMATSLCPYTNFLKPMARFHLPFSTSEETIVRSISMYLLKQYFVAKRGGQPDLELELLEKNYADIQKVNLGILARIRGIAQGDADANAITILHSFSSLLTMAISKDLSKIEPLFK
ncbi:MAG: hypothetical protein SGI74_00460 [Oligoflexia bacterium]|nr:hypothetical protein [Oligoflexia bacterium]